MIFELFSANTLALSFHYLALFEDKIMIKQSY